MSHRVKDPVCGMPVDPSAAGGTSQHAGQAYYFCSSLCQARFAERPDLYVKAGRRAARDPALARITAETALKMRPPLFPAETKITLSNHRDPTEWFCF